MSMIEDHGYDTMASRKSIIMKPDEIASLRLANQRLAGSGFRSPRDLVAWMGAMQAQDYGMAKWAIGLRLRGAKIDTVQGALDRGEIIRTHLLRPTWHLVAAEDYAWMLELTAPRIRAATRSRHRQLGLTDAVIARSEVIFGRLMRGGKHASRATLIAALGKAGIATDENRASHIFLCAELDGVLCSGPDVSGRPTYALRAERIPAAKSLPRDEALAMLAKRYFMSRGPATLQDFVWWSGLTAGEAKRALESVRGGLEPATADSGVCWSGEASAPPAASRRGSAHLLPAFDEYILGYRDRSAALSANAQRKTISSNGMFWPVVLIDGRAAGLWKRTIKNDTVVIEVDLFERLSRAAKAHIEKAAGRFGSFLGKTPSVRFPADPPAKRKSRIARS
jgi:hypothetical protein